ncbi:MAG: Galactokinase [Acidobacteria bacterium]|nr:Galactokinase [Acidobacteriota bacterium]
MIEQHARTFEILFDRPSAATADAPGRVNLIGEHTDYSGGFVFPIATPQRTRVALAPRVDRRVRAWSRDVGDEEAWIEYGLGDEARTGHWGDYIAGVTASLRESGQVVGGFDARIESDLPLGGGLSSSASLEVALLRGLRAMFGLPLDDVALAKIAQRAETGLVGAPVGIMDQMAASLADEHAALFLDTRSLVYERIPLPAATGLIVIHSGVTHRHAGGEYRTRRAECEAAARLLGVRELRDATVADLARTALPPPLDRRARHVVTENDRVLRARDALTAGDAQQFGRLMAASHASMRDDFEISTPEIDLLVGLTRDEAGVYGARLTGGGFGGSIVALADAGRAAAAAARVALEYARRVPLRPTVLIP